MLFKTTELSWNKNITQKKTVPFRIKTSQTLLKLPSCIDKMACPQTMRYKRSSFSKWLGFRVLPNYALPSCGIKKVDIISTTARSISGTRESEFLSCSSKLISFYFGSNITFIVMRSRGRLLKRGRGCLHTRVMSTSSRSYSEELFFYKKLYYIMNIQTTIHKQKKIKNRLFFVIVVVVFNSLNYDHLWIAWFD